MPSITYSIVPTGGAINLFPVASSGATSMVLTRYVSGSTGLGPGTVLVSGAVVPYFLDVGDQTGTALVGANEYVYELSDSGGVVYTPGIYPSSEITIVPDQLTEILLRLFEAGVNNLVPPPGIKTPSFRHAMPIDQLPALPLIVLNQSLLQQEQIPVGQNVENADESGDWTLTGFAKRIYLISVLTRDPIELEYFRDAVIGIFNAILGSVMSQIGINVSHRYQAASGQDSEDSTRAPGFYYSDMMIELTGTYNVGITTNYGIIQTISGTVSSALGSNQSVDTDFLITSPT